MTTLLRMRCPECGGNLAETDGKDTWCLMCTHILKEEPSKSLTIPLVGAGKGSTSRQRRQERDKKIFALSGEGVLDIALKLGVCERAVQRALRRKGVMK